MCQSSYGGSERVPKLPYSGAGHDLSNHNRAAAGLRLLFGDGTRLPIAHEFGGTGRRPIAIYRTELEEF